MDAKRWVAVAACVGIAVTAAGCGSTPTTASRTVTVTVTSTTTTEATTATGTATTATGTMTTGTVTTATGGAQNLVVTNTLRAELLQAAAAGNGIPASDYSGLRPGQTYYAYDPATGTYWAGAALIPKSSSIKAQVSVQDDGAYLLFTKPSGGSWKVYPVGMTGVAGATCPVAVPPAVLRVWGWPAGACRSGG